MRDPAFGPVVMVGLGGIWVEVLGDVAFAMAPLHRAEARALLATLRGHALLTGARGGAAVDLDALADVVVAAGNRCWPARTSPSSTSTPSSPPRRAPSPSTGR